MKSVKMMFAAAIFATALGTPAYAQMHNDGAMAADSHMKMSAMDKRKMARCHKMSHRAMMRNHGCAKMMKMHSDMMAK